MPIPPNAHPFTRPMDPTDIVDYVAVLTQGVAPDAFLAPGESVASYTLALTPEAVAVGLVIKSGGGYETTFANNCIRFWLEIDPDEQASAMFDGGGVTLGLELTVITNSAPQRKKQRTLTVQVANQ